MTTWLISAGLPSLNKVVWIVVQLIYQRYQADETSIESCPLVQRDRETDVILVKLKYFWNILLNEENLNQEIPILILLILNFIFLIWVVIVSPQIFQSQKAKILEHNYTDVKCSPSFKL